MLTSEAKSVANIGCFWRATMNNDNQETMFVRMTLMMMKSKIMMMMMMMMIMTMIAVYNNRG